MGEKAVQTYGDHPYTPANAAMSHTPMGSATPPSHQTCRAETFCRKKSTDKPSLLPHLSNRTHTVSFQHEKASLFFVFLILKSRT